METEVITDDQIKKSDRELVINRIGYLKIL